MSGIKRAEFGASKPICLNMCSLARFLTRAFPSSTAKQVAHLCGLPASTVEKWLRGECKPSGEALCALIAVFGPAFLSAICPRAAWVQEVAHERDELQAYRTIFAAQTQVEKTRCAIGA